MGHSGGQLKVGSTVELLNRFMPDRLSALRQRFPDPDSAAVLTPGGDVLGEEGMAPALAATAQLLEGLDAVCLNAVLAVRRKLSWTNSLDLFGKLVAASSFGTLIIVILQMEHLSDPTGKALALAIVGLVATAAPLVVSLIRGGIGGDAGLLVDQFAALRDISFEARDLRTKLPLVKSDDEQSKLVSDANDVAKRAWKLLIDLGYDPRDTSQR